MSAAKNTSASAVSFIISMSKNGPPKNLLGRIHDVGSVLLSPVIYRFFACPRGRRLSEKWKNVSGVLRPMDRVLAAAITNPNTAL